MYGIRRVDEDSLSQSLSVQKNYMPSNKASTSQVQNKQKRGGSSYSEVAHF